MKIHRGIGPEAMTADWRYADADFLIIDLCLIDHGADVSPPKWRFAREDVRSHCGEPLSTANTTRRGHYGTKNASRIVSFSTPKGAEWRCHHRCA
jgi:hypothetical protein